MDTRLVIVGTAVAFIILAIAVWTLIGSVTPSADELKSWDQQQTEYNDKVESFCATDDAWLSQEHCENTIRGR